MPRYQKVRKDKAKEAKRSREDSPPASRIGQRQPEAQQADGLSNMTLADSLLDARTGEQKYDLAMQLQKTYGNRYVQRLMRSMAVQAKLTVSQPDDRYEVEADNVAEEVTAKAASNLQRQENPEDEETAQTKISRLQRQEGPEEEEMIQSRASDLQRAGGPEEEEPLQGKISGVQRAEGPEEEEMIQGRASDLQRAEGPEEEEPLQGKISGVQRAEGPEDEEALQARGAGAPPEVDGDLENRINSARGAGHPLADATRATLEPRFGQDFSGVRVHTDGEAGRLSRELSAEAFTTGRDIFFGDGKYQPETSDGKELIAHELTHVVQQGGSPAVRRQVLEAASLGVAVFTEGRSLATSGALSHSATTVNYIHENTPPDIRWQEYVDIIEIKAAHKWPFSTQHFYFRLSYEYNGYDLRNVAINILRDRSSRMLTSEFSIQWVGQAHSVPRDPVAQIMFQISGHWDPAGRGLDSFWGNLLLNARGTKSINVQSENGWVWTE
jgi:hypothetical protein